MTVRHLGTAFALAAMVGSGVACGSSLFQPDGGGSDGPGGTGSGGTGAGGGGGGGSDARVDRPPVVNRQVDVLFMIDNSSSMELSQANLNANFSSFTDTLKTLPGGLPNLHIAVITSDMGAGPYDIPGCGKTGDGGIFKSGVGFGALNCTATGLNPGATFITTTGGTNPQNNFTGDLTDVFKCIAPVGAQGCGFEHQLASISRALGADGQTAPVENQGFLRDDAALVIVMLTNEDDCSAPDSLFTTADMTLASPLGPVAGFRCNEFGHLCDGTHPARLSLTGMVGDTRTYTSCVPAESAGMVTPVATFISQIKSVKRDPAAQILVASIQGPTTPYQVTWRAAGVTDTGPWPWVDHSCTAADKSFADPGVRLKRFVESFGANGLQFSICESFSPALTTLATRLSQLIGS